MSRELDARVAEAMGWAFIGERENGFAMEVVGVSPNRPAYQTYRIAIPAFSTDPAACEEVKKEIRRRTFDHDISWSSGGYRVTLKGGVSNHVGSHYCEYTAICLAFLAAVEAEKGAKQ